MYTGSMGKMLSFLPKLPFPVPECRSSCCRIRIEGYSVAFQLSKWLMTTLQRQRREHGEEEEEEGWQWENVLWKDRGNSLGVGGSLRSCGPNCSWMVSAVAAAQMPFLF